jgi:hypothetical protein
MEKFTYRWNETEVVAHIDDITSIMKEREGCMVNFRNDSEIYRSTEEYGALSERFMEAKKARAKALHTTNGFMAPDLQSVAQIGEAPTS